MKAVILAGGYATRIRPVSYYLNKHMWPIYDRPIIEHVLESIVWANINDVGIVLGGAHPRQIRDYLGDGTRFGVELTYIWQGAPKGIAHAVYRAKKFVGNEKFIVHLADNLLEDPLEDVITEFEGNCLVVLKEGADVKRFGCAEFKDDKLVRIIEKPEEPLSNYAQVGVYGFDSYFFEVFPKLEPSWRGEYEQADVINRYLQEDQNVNVKFLDRKWFDCGTFESILDAGEFIRQKQRRRQQRNES